MPMSCFQSVPILFLFVLLACQSGWDHSTDQVLFSGSGKSASFNHPTGNPENDAIYGKGALLLSRFDSLAELKSVIRIEYDRIFSPLSFPLIYRPVVRIVHESGGRKVESVLMPGVSEGDFAQARDGGLKERFSLLVRSPYAVWRRKDLQRVYALSRWRDNYYGEGDVAFFNLAETMMHHITGYDRQQLPDKVFGEKGFINTFNHVIAQAFMTTQFSERLADFVADAHERHHMPELITGNFTAEQIVDIDTGPTDNYLDMINNEWGQEIGKELKRKYLITRATTWTPRLVQDYLNDIQHYCREAFQVGFDPFYASDEIVIRFSRKIESVRKDIPLMK